MSFCFVFVDLKKTFSALLNLNLIERLIAKSFENYRVNSWRIICHLILRAYAHLRTRVHTYKLAPWQQSTTEERMYIPKIKLKAQSASVKIS